MKAFTLEAHFGRANIKSMARSDRIDETVLYWGEQLEKLKHREPDGRQASKDVIIQCLTENKHHTDPAAAQMVCAALVWMTATGDIGPSVLPYMRAGDMTIIYEITHLGGKQYNFRTRFRRKNRRGVGALTVQRMHKSREERRNANWDCCTLHRRSRFRLHRT